MKLNFYKDEFTYPYFHIAGEDDGNTTLTVPEEKVLWVKESLARARAVQNYLYYLNQEQND